MFSKLLVSIVLVPVVLGMVAARSRRRRGVALRLLALVGAYDVLYLFLLYYLRYRWVG
jgi:predicted Na+-dependent transporter